MKNGKSVLTNGIGKLSMAEVDNTLTIRVDQTVTGVVNITRVFTATPTEIDIFLKNNPELLSESIEVIAREMFEAQFLPLPHTIEEHVTDWLDIHDQSIRVWEEDFLKHKPRREIA